MPFLFNQPGGGGGGGVTDHAALTSLLWTVSGHTGAAGSIALFDNLGAASLLTGLAQGSVVFYDGTNWTQLAPGVAGQQLQTQGAGANPIWGPGAGGATLQTAYDGLNTILTSVAEGGPVAITTTVDETASGLSVTAGAHTAPTAETLVSLVGDALSNAPLLVITNPSPGANAKAIYVDVTGDPAGGFGSEPYQIKVDFTNTGTPTGSLYGLTIDFGTALLTDNNVFTVGLNVDYSSAPMNSTTEYYGLWLQGRQNLGAGNSFGIVQGGGFASFDVGYADFGDGGLGGQYKGFYLVDGVKIGLGSGVLATYTSDYKIVFATVATGGKGIGLNIVPDRILGAGDGDGPNIIVESSTGGAATGVTNAGNGGKITLATGDGGDAGAGSGNSGVGGNYEVTCGLGGAADATGPENAQRGGAFVAQGGIGGAGAGAGLSGAGGYIQLLAGVGGAGSALTPGGSGGAFSLQGGVGGADGGGGPGPDGAISVGTGTAGAITVGGAQTGAVKVSTAAGNNSAVLSLSALGVAGESFAIYGGTGDPTGVTSADTGSTWHRDTGTNGAAYLNTSNAGSGTTWSRIVVDLTVEAKTATYAVDATNDQGRTFTNEGAAGLASARPFNLPTAVAGESFTFITQDADLLRVVAAAGDTIRLGSTVSAVAGNIESTAIGDVIELIAINATEWIARSIVGTWTVT